MATLLKLLALWFVILLLAVANGGLREAVLLKSFDRSSAFVISGLLRGQSLATLLDAYRFRDGNIWPLVLVVVALAPTVAALVRGTLVREGS